MRAKNAKKDKKAVVTASNFDEVITALPAGSPIGHSMGSPATPTRDAVPASFQTIYNAIHEKIVDTMREAGGRQILNHWLHSYLEGLTKEFRYSVVHWNAVYHIEITNQAGEKCTVSPEGGFYLR